MKGGIPWAKLILIAAFAWAGWAIYSPTDKSGGRLSSGGRIGDDAPSSELAALASAVAPGEVVIYTTPHCPYCAQAKSWLNQYNFAFTECDADARPECAQALQALGGDGVPFLTVRGQKMEDGFDSDEFVSLVRR